MPSLSELSRSANVSKSTLSEIERGQGNPSLDTLWSIAVALGIHLSVLFDDPAPSPVALLRYADAPVIAADEGGVTVRHLRNLHDGAVELYEVDFLRAGSGRDSAAHTAGQIEHLIEITDSRFLVDAQSLVALKKAGVSEAASIGCGFALNHAR